MRIVTGVLFAEGKIRTGRLFAVCSRVIYTRLRLKGSYIQAGFIWLVSVGVLLLILHGVHYFYFSY